jgi:osmotically-inducible protein OsmY
MRVINVLLAAVFVVVGMSVPRAAHADSLQTSGVSVDDQTLASRITAQVKNDASLAGYKIAVHLDDGVATIGGTVQSESQRRRVQRLATIPGVKHVRNEMVVDPTARPTRTEPGSAGTTGNIDRAGAKTQAGADKAVDATGKGASVAIEKTKEGVGKAVDATKRAVAKAVGGATVAKDAGQNVGQTVGEAFSDGWITTKVKGKIVDDALVKDSDIKVETADHVVTLKGTVVSADAKARAEEIARATDGVQQVVNLLVLETK